LPSLPRNFVVLLKLLEAVIDFRISGGGGGWTNLIWSELKKEDEEFSLVFMWAMVFECCVFSVMPLSRLCTERSEVHFL